MGVNLYLLDRRRVRLNIGGTIEDVGMLRRSWKLTEFDQERRKEREKAAIDASGMPSPKAAMLADVEELPVGSRAGFELSAHLVIGWDDGRTEVTDWGWDYLPVLGYAIRAHDTDFYVLHELRDRALHLVDAERASQLRLIDRSASIVRLGQPLIIECRSVRLYIDGYAQADCTFDNHRREMLLIMLENNALPDPSWLVGKRPMDVERFSALRSGDPNTSSNLQMPQQ